MKKQWSVQMIRFGKYESEITICGHTGRWISVKTLSLNATGSRLRGKAAKKAKEE